MRLLRTIAMNTDHGFYGNPIETSRIELYVSDDIVWTPEMIEIAKQHQEERLHSLAKRMPHRYWHDLKKEPK